MQGEKTHTFWFEVKCSGVKSRVSTVFLKLVSSYFPQGKGIRKSVYPAKITSNSV